MLTITHDNGSESIQWGEVQSVDRRDLKYHDKYFGALLLEFKTGKAFYLYGDPAKLEELRQSIIDGLRERGRRELDREHTIKFYGLKPDLDPILEPGARAEKVSALKSQLAVIPRYEKEQLEAAEAQLAKARDERLAGIKSIHQSQIKGLKRQLAELGA